MCAAVAPEQQKSTKTSESVGIPRLSLVTSSRLQQAQVYLREDEVLESWMFLFREQRTNIHIPAIHGAVVQHDLDHLKRLLGHHYRLDRRTKSTGSTVLHYAAALPEKDAYKFVDAILSKTAPKQEDLPKGDDDSAYTLLDVDVLDNLGYTPLHRAAEVGNVVTIKFLITKGADFNKISSSDGHSAKSLLWKYATTERPAIKKNTFAAASAGFSKKSKKNAGLKRKKSPPTFSSSQKKAGAASGDTSKKITIHDAVSERNLASVQQIFDKEKKKKEEEENPLFSVVNSVIGEGWTPLHQIAALSGDMGCEIIDKLCENGANIDAVDANGFTPLHIAATNGNISIMKHLLKKKANCDALVSEKYTACDLLWRRVVQGTDAAKKK